MNEKTYISWEEFHLDVKNLSKKIKALGEFNKIVTITRGGLIPAAIVAYELDIRDVEVINVKSYDDNVPRILEEIEVSSKDIEVDEKTLIIDDLSDTGRTFRVLKTLFPKGVYVVVYSKTEGLNMVDIYEKAVPDKWIVFPWD